MDVSADRLVQIAQGINAMYTVADKYNLDMNIVSYETTDGGTAKWYEVYAHDVVDVVDVVDAVRETFDGDLGNIVASNQVFDVASANGWSVEEDNEGQLVLYTNVYSKECV